MKDVRGLSTKNAMQRLCDDLETAIQKERSHLDATNRFFSFRWLSHETSSGGYCCLSGLAALFSGIALFCINLFSCSGCSDLIVSVLLLCLTLSNIFVSFKLYQIRRLMALSRSAAILSELRAIQDDAIVYDGIYQPYSDAISTQCTLRDQQLFNVPWALLVYGDVIKLRAGQAAPCRCVSPSGIILEVGDKPISAQKICERTGGVIPLQATWWTVLESPVIKHLRTVFHSYCNRPRSFLDTEFLVIQHHLFERNIYPTMLALTISIVIIRYSIGFADSTVTTLISIILFATMPLHGPMLPMFCLLFHLWCLAFVLGDSAICKPNIRKSNRYSQKIFVENSNSPSFRTGLRVACHLLKGLVKNTPSTHTSLDFVFTCGGMTSCTFLDKRGFLSWPNATPEKIICFEADDSSAKRNNVITKTLDLSLSNDAGPFAVHFDQPSWTRHRGSLISLGISIALNGCGHHSSYMEFIDHVTAISQSVPKHVTVANRRCMCSLLDIIGIGADSLKEFDLNTVKKIGIYQGTSNQNTFSRPAKFLVPVENAFAVVAKDAHSMFHHILCQGTAHLLLANSSHIWCGNKLEPLNEVLKKRLADCYQRYAMTGICLGFGYGVNGRALSEKLVKRYIKMQLNKPDGGGTLNENVRSLSQNSIALKSFYCSETIDNVNDFIENCLSRQTLCGLIVLRYQARSDVVRLVEQLDSACIRFIHFSKENELRSRVFAEKLGLEAGWNCHISLASNNVLRSSMEYLTADILIGAKSSVCESKTHYHTSSCSEYSDLSVLDRSSSPHFLNSKRHSPHAGSTISLKDSNYPKSQFSWSEETAQTLPNMAKLPSGIENIRPHIENVDNVPLLVNLFTDCDEFSTIEMIKIMQDCGEVILAIGSSLNFNNGAIFVQANCSICMEPQYPVICCKNPSPEKNDEHVRSSALASLLMSICCDVYVPADQTLDLISMISLWRHHLRLFRSALLFFFLSSLAVFAQQFLSLLFFLPNIFDLLQVFLFVIIYIPLLGFSMIFSAHRRAENLDEIAYKNSASVARSFLRRSLIYFAMTFLPTLYVVVFIFYASLNHEFELSQKGTNNTVVVDDSLTIARNSVAFFFLLYICVLSSGFVHFRSNSWIRNPCRNIVWLCAICCSIVVQAIRSCLISCSLQVFIKQCPIAIVTISIGWIVVIAVMSELSKYHYIKLYRRDQRRRKLCFNTKLGMNSPY